MSERLYDTVVTSLHQLETFFSSTFSTSGIQADLNLWPILDEYLQQWTHSPLLKEALSPLHHFINSVDWTEKWITGLLFFHFFLFVLIVLSRKHPNVLTVLFLFSLGLAWAGPLVNKLGQDHWRQFSHTNYFDQNGMFITIMLSIPQMCLAAFSVIMLLSFATDLMVQVKQLQLNHKKLKQQ